MDSMSTSEPIVLIGNTVPLSPNVDDTIIVGDSDGDVVVVIKPQGNIDGAIKINVAGDDMGVDTSNLITALIEVDGDITGTVELCFWTVLEADEIKDAKLVFVDESEDCLEVADDSLERKDTRSRNGVTESLVCGETDHFTSFAVLLGGVDGDGSAGICSSDSDTVFTLIFILSLASFSFACVVVLLIIIVYSIILHREERRYEDRLLSIERSNSMMQRFSSFDRSASLSKDRSYSVFTATSDNRVLAAIS